MDETSVQIEEIFSSGCYGPLFSFNLTDIQIYFDKCCQEGREDRVRLAKLLFPQIDCVNALLHTYRNNMLSMFVLLLPDKSSDLAELLISDCYSFNGNDPTKCVNNDFIGVMIERNLCDCDQLFIIAAKLNNINLAKTTFPYTGETTKMIAFKIAYENGFYSIVELIYGHIRCNRIHVSDYYDYCPSGNIIALVAFQEFYDWKTQLKNSILHRNHYAIEELVLKVPKGTAIEFSILSDLLESATDSLLGLICSRLSIKGIDKYLVYATMRRPMINYLDQSGDWLVV